MKTLLPIAFALIFQACPAQKATAITQYNGKVGIGTKTPDKLLTVKGTIHTREVLVDLKGAVAPDYVFQHYFLGESKLKPNYTLMSLPALGAFIETNHHLPKIPTAKTLGEHGLKLKEMNLLLLEKVEELTLYLLQQQKQLHALREEVDTLKASKN